MKKWLIRIAGGFGVLVLLLVLVVGISWYRIFGRNQPLVAGQAVGPATTLVDSFVAIYAVPTDTGVLLIDAGADPTGAALTAGLADMGFAPEDVVAVFLTHGHSDHIAAAAMLDAPVYALAAEAPIVSGAERPTSMVGRFGGNDGSVVVTNPMADGETVTVDGVDVTAFATPGHTVGSAAYVVGNAVFLGDTANSFKDGSIHGGVGIFTDDLAQNHEALAALDARLPPTVTVVGFGHSGPTDIDALRAFTP